MRRIEIHLDPKLKGRGYSGSKYYEDEDGYMTLGCTNEGAKPRVFRLTASYNSLPDVSLYGGEAEHMKLLELLKQQNPKHTWGTKIPEINEFMWSLLLRGLDGEKIKTIVEAAVEMGVERGIRQNQKDLRQVLGLYEY